MKFWAILKDSLREAIDCKVMYATVGLSCLVFVIVGSISYKPMPAETTLKYLVSGNLVRLMAPALGDVPNPDGENPFVVDNHGPYRLQSFRVEKGAADSPDSEYALVVQRVYPDVQTARKARDNPEPELEQIRDRLSPADWKLLLVDNARLLPDAPDGAKDAERSLFFELNTRPTPATRRMWTHEPVIFGAFPIRELTLPLGLLLHGLSSFVLAIGSWVTILVSVIITAFFIPNMLRKGTVDLLLAKPISRWTLLGFKFLGGLIFIFLNTSFTIVGIWLILGLRSGVWANSFLLMIFVITFFFAILYAVSTLFAVLTRSAVVAILVTCGAWFWFFLVGTVNQVLTLQDQKEEAKKVPAAERTSAGAFATVAKAIHFVTPRTSDLNVLSDRILLSDFMTGKVAELTRTKATNITWESSITVSLLFMALILGLACWRFAVKDY